MTNQGVSGFPSSTVAWPTVTPFNLLATPTTSSGADTVAQASGSYGGTHRSVVSASDYHEFTAYLRRGVYTVDVYLTLASSGGILIPTLDGLLIGSNIDTYNGAGGTQRTTVTGVNVPATGLHTLRLASSSTKNASSSGFTCRVSFVLFTRILDA